MQYTKLIIIGLFVLILSGCDVVYTTNPIGEKPTMITTKKWEGTWINPGGSLMIKVVDEEKGLLKAAWIEGADNLHMEVVEVSLRDGVFWSTRDKDHQEKEQYFWGLFKNEDRQIVLWLPDVEEFRNLVKDGKMPGEIQGDNVMLGDLESTHLEMIISEDSGLLFDWKNPLVFMRITGEDG